MTTAAAGETTSQGAVIPTRPARIPFKVIETSGFLYHAHVKNIAAQAAAHAERFVVMNTFAANRYGCESAAAVGSINASVDAGLNPNQPNQRMNTPRAPARML